MSEEKILSQPFIDHIIELRNRLLRSVIVVLLIFLGLFSFSNDLYLYISEPLRLHLPNTSSMIATDVASPFLTPFKLTLVLSLFAAMPFILYQVWAFVAPGLYQREKKIVLPLFFSSVLLFYGGMAFAYYVVFPLVFMFFTSVGPEGVAVMTDIRSYLDFVLKLFFAFGISFQIPIGVVILTWMGIIEPDNLAKQRPYVFVICFVFGMLLTPPDILSQTLLAVPMWRKGEESGHIQRVGEIRLDCDGDVIVLQVEQLGGIACHTGRASCFYRVLKNGQWHTVDPVLKDPGDIYS